MVGHRQKHFTRAAQRGFTIVELLIVIVVIAILATIVTVAYNGAMQKARDAKRLTDITAVYKALQEYYAENGSYPVTATPFGAGLADANCKPGTTAPVSAQWVPGLVPKYLPSLPQSFGPRAEASSGCYQYASDGTSYVLSAWRNIESGPNTTTNYLRLGFREGWAAAGDTAVRYYCNTSAANATYWDDWYKYSYTFSNVPPC